MKSIEESVVTAMDGTDIELFPFIPYILQDSWEIGADPEVIISLIAKHKKNTPDLRVLDLGCGKGAVTVNIAQKLNCFCHGIDALVDFIEYAKKKAIEYHVDHLCRFEVGDIREMITELPAFDIIILGAIGPVFGDYFSTLTKLSACLDPAGIFIIDDGYIEKTSDYNHPLILKKERLYKQIESSGMKLIDEVIIPGNSIKDSNNFVFVNLERRCKELIIKFPYKKHLFENYIKKQKEENYILENLVTCSTMVIKRQPPC